MYPMLWSLVPCDDDATASVYVGEDCLLAGLPYAVAQDLVDAHNWSIAAARYHEAMAWVKRISLLMVVSMVCIVVFIWF